MPGGSEARDRLHSWWERAVHSEFERAAHRGRPSAGRLEVLEPRAAALSLIDLWASRTRVHKGRRWAWRLTRIMRHLLRGFRHGAGIVAERRAAGVPTFRHSGAIAAAAWRQLTANSFRASAHRSVQRATARLLTPGHANIRADSPRGRRQRAVGGRSGRPHNLVVTCAYPAPDRNSLQLFSPTALCASAPRLPAPTARSAPRHAANCMRRQVGPGHRAGVLLPSAPRPSMGGTGERPARRTGAGARMSLGIPSR